MYFGMALVATMAYALQGALLASYYRRMDRLSVVAYRGLSLALTMLPLLWWVEPWDGAAVWHAAPVLVAAVVTSAVANWCNANALCCLPVGIAMALCTSFTAIFSVFLGYCVLGETLEAPQFGFIALLLAGVLLLGSLRSQGPLPAEYNLGRGLVIAVCYGLFMSVGYVLVGIASRQVHPVLVGYLWEGGIGVFVACVALGRGRLGGASLARVSGREFGQILLYAAPTALGSALYPLATRGAFILATAILSTMMVFSSLLAMLFYGERLTLRQWALMLFICLMVAGLRLSS